VTGSIAYDPADLTLLAGIEERHFWFRARRRIIVAALARWFPDARNYLEIGCGTGYTLRGIAAAFPAWKTVASDALARGAGIANGAGGALLQLDIRHIPFHNEFDVIGAYDVLEHIADDGGALDEIRRACRPGGGVLLTVPQHPWLWSTADDYAHHYRRYTARCLRALAERAGFQVLWSSSFNTLNLPFLLLRTGALRATGRNPQASVPAGPANWLLERSMDIDRMLIRAGLRLPVGGSLALAARRPESRYS
jgi:SAM-dependent methyltransferase